MKTNEIPRKYPGKSATTTVGIAVTPEMRERMRNFPDVNWSAFMRVHLLEGLEALETEAKHKTNRIHIPPLRDGRKKQQK